MAPKQGTSDDIIKKGVVLCNTEKHFMKLPTYKKAPEDIVRNLFNCITTQYRTIEKIINTKDYSKLEDAVKNTIDKLDEIDNSRDIWEDENEKIGMSLNDVHITEKTFDYFINSNIKHECDDAYNATKTINHFIQINSSAIPVGFMNYMDKLLIKHSHVYITISQICREIAYIYLDMRSKVERINNVP